MDIEIVSQKENPLLHRIEVALRVHHPGKQTPKREEVAELVKSQLNAKSKVVVVDHLSTEFGRAVTRGYAKVYDNKEAAAKVEAEHLLVRNGLAEKNVAGAAGTPAKKGG